MKYNNNNSNEKEYNKKKKRGEKKKEKTQWWTMQLLTTHWPMPQQWSAPPGQLPPVYILGMMFHGIEYPFG